jgi:asparagine synthase (glutamine-hydrolysing)
VTITRYWFPERTAEVRLRSDGEYVERFLELYANAVRVRTRTTRAVVGTLSSGLDSGSVTALAMRALRGEGKGMVAFTSVPLHQEVRALAPRIVVDEWDLAHAAAEWIGGVEHRALRSESVTPLAALERSLWLHDEPEYAAGNLFWLIDLLGQSRAAGAGVLLTGQMGNGGVSWTGDQQRVFRGFLRARWIDAWRGLQAFRRMRGISLARAAWAQVVVPLRRTVSSARFRYGWIGPPSADELFAPGFAARMNVAVRMRREGYDPYFSKPADALTQRLWVLLPRINPVGALWAESGAAYGLDVRDPTSDVRLLEYCLSVPDEQYVREGQDRALMRRSMEGLLPPAVQWNHRRGLQGADLVFRLRADRSATAAAIDEVTASPVAREYMNVDAIRSMWTTVLGKNDASVLATASVLSRALLIALFVTREADGRR